MSPRFGFTPVVPPFEGAGQEEGVVSSYMAKLESLGGTRWELADYDDPAPLCLLVATGGTEGVVLGLHARRQAGVPGEPVLLIAHPGNNSLPASLEVLARLQQDGAQGRIIYLRGIDDEAGFAVLGEALHDARVRAALRSARIGVIGKPSDWLVASSPPSGVVADTWGPELVHVEVESLRQAMRDATPAEVALGTASLSEGSTETVEPSAEAISDASRVTVALRSIVAEHGLNAVTVRCFDLVLEDGTSGCYALSDVPDAGVIAGCEGDVVSTIGMLWANTLLGEVPWMANPADIDEQANSILLAHCTVPRSLLESYRLRSHFESGLGVGIQGTLPRGPVTLLRIGGTMLDALWLAEGQLVETGDAENLCRTQARIALTRGDVRDLLSAPLGNHIVMVYGHHADRLATWWETML